MKHVLTAAVVFAGIATAGGASVTGGNQTVGRLFDASLLTASEQTPQAAHEKLWQVKENKGKGNGKSKGKKHKTANKQKAAKQDHKKQDHKADKKYNKSEDKGHSSAKIKIKSKDGVKFDRDAANLIARDILTVRAPQSRDMATLLGAAALIFARPDLVIANVPDDELLTYRNCPPGLAKKDPPCVPPGLAKKGVTYDQWARYSEEDYDRLWEERRAPLLTDDVVDEDTLLLGSDQIRQLYGLDAAPIGQRYGLIDGLPVLLSDKDYASLLRINALAQTSGLSNDLRVAPTAAFSQAELIQTYRLAAPAAGYNYAVLNGQVVTLADSAYETLQLIRVARAVF